MTQTTTTATASKPPSPWFIRVLLSSVGRKLLMSATGLCLALFLLLHALGNSTLFWGPAAFEGYARRLHGLGPLVGLFEAGLLAVFLLHVATALSLWTRNSQARPGRYRVRARAGGRTWASATMPYTGLFILLFVAVHLAGVRVFAPGEPLFQVVRQATAGNALVLGCYVLGLVALGLHLGHGLWSLLQSAGVNHPRYNGFLQAAARTLAVVLVLVFFAALMVIATA